MKRYLVILALIFTVLLASAQDVKVIGKDFWVTDDKLRPISVGLCSWSDEDADFQLGGICNFSLINLWDNHLRIGTGFAVSTKDNSSNIKMDLRLVGPTVTTLVFDSLELGFYVAPFWNLYNGQRDDPYGFIIGYAFGF